MMKKLLVHLIIVSITLFLSSEALQAQTQIPQLREKGLGDEELQHLPSNLEELSLRGSRGYGIDYISDVGIAHLIKYPRLRILRAGGFELTDTCLETICQLTELEELALDSNQLTGEKAALLLRLKKLRKLNLFSNPLTSDVFETVSKMERLEDLSVDGPNLKVDDQTLKYCSKLQHLINLTLPHHCNEVTDRGLKDLATLRRLKSIVLEDARFVTGEGLMHLGNMSNLESIVLNSLPSVLPGSLSWIDNLRELRRVQIADVLVNQDDLRRINKLPKIESLTLWSIFPNGLDDNRIEQLNGLAQLREFRTNVEVAPEAVFDLAHCLELMFISGGLTRVTDVELKALSKLPKLQSLDIDSEGVTEKSLAALATMKALRFLFVSERVRLTESQLKTLGNDSLADCQIQLLNPPYTVLHKAIVND